MPEDSTTPVAGETTEDTAVAEKIDMPESVADAAVNLPAIRQSPLSAQLAYAEKLAQSNLLPKDFRANPANVLFAIQYGDMLGLAPMAAITGIHVIEGKPSASAALMSALVRRAGHRMRVSGDSTKATAQIVRSDDPTFTFEVTWTIADAERAGLLAKKGGNWAKYPAAMLKARAISQVARDACEEALLGMHYTPEELGAQVDEDGVPLNVVGGTIVDVEPEPAPDFGPFYFYRDKIRSASTQRELAAVVKQARADVKIAPDGETSLFDEALARKATLEAGAAGGQPAVDDEGIVDAVIVEDGEQGARERADDAHRHAQETAQGPASEHAPEPQPQQESARNHAPETGPSPEQSADDIARGRLTGEAVLQASILGGDVTKMFPNPNTSGLAKLQEAVITGRDRVVEHLEQAGDMAEADAWSRLPGRAVSIEAALQAMRMAAATT